MHERCAKLTVLTVVAMAFIGGQAAGRPAAAEQAIGLYVDGQPVEFRSHVLCKTLPPVLVEGYAMIPARFISEVLGARLDDRLVPWGILRVDKLAFKVGVEEVCWFTPMEGEDAVTYHWLDLAPRIISGTHYVPARITLNLLGHGVEWDAVERAVRITRNGAPEKSYRYG